MTTSALQTILAEAEAVDGFSAISDQAVLAAEQGSRTVLMRGTDAAGVIGDGEVDLVVRPEARGHGLGRALLTDLLASPAAGHGELRAWSHGENPAAETLLREAGFTPVRTLFRLALAPSRLPEAVTAARPLPDGFRIEAFDGALESPRAREWVSVNAAAFADHPEQGAVTLEDFSAYLQQDWFDPEDLLFAIDETNEALAGYGWIKTLRGAQLETELYVLGVAPTYAGRGLGAALFGASLARMQRLGTTRITLYVDESNSHAVELYRRGGFETDQRSTQWLRSADLS